MSSVDMTTNVQAFGPRLFMFIKHCLVNLYLVSHLECSVTDMIEVTPLSHCHLF